MVVKLFSPSDSQSSLKLCLFSGSTDRRNPHSLVEPSGAIDKQGFQGFSIGYYGNKMSLVSDWGGPRRTSAFPPSHWEIN